MKRVIKTIKDNKYIIIFFTILYLFAMTFIPSITANLDEELEQKIVLSNINSYANFFRNKELSEALSRSGAIMIGYSEESDHGVAPYYPLFPLLMLKNQTPNTVSIIWQIYAFTIFFIGVIYLYKLLQLLFNNPKISTIITLLYYLSPRILIDSLHNNKDITFMTLLVISIYYLAKIIKKDKNKYMSMFAIVAALLSNIKILGVFFTGVLALTYILYLLINKKMSKEKVLDIIFVFFVYFLIFFIITPAMWDHGLHIIQHFKYCLDNSTNFSRWTGKITFEGNVYKIDGDNLLPWYFIIKNIVITLPVVLILLFIISFMSIIVILIKRIIEKKKISLPEYIMLSCQIMFLVPLIIAVVSHPNVYNVWRHFYFLYGLMLIISSYILYVSQNSKVRYLLVLLIVISLTSSVYNLTRYGINNTAYYNILVGQKDLSKKYELDYYAITTKDAINKFMKANNYKTNKNEKLYLYTIDCPVKPDYLKKALFNSYNLKDKVVVIDEKDVEEYTKDNKPVYLVMNTVYSFKDFSKYKLVYKYKYKNNSVVDFYLVND